MHLRHHISAFTSALLYARTPGAARLRHYGIFAVSAGLGLLAGTDLAAASGTTLKQYNAMVVQNTNNIQDVITYVAYIGGAAFAALGIVDMKKHVENPTQTPLKNGIAKIGFGGMLLALPFLASVASSTVGGTGSVQGQTFGRPPNVNG